MRSPGDFSGEWFVHTVVVDMHGHSQDVHCCIHGEDEQDTVIGIRVNVIQVIYSTSFQPCTIDLEPETRQIVAAFSEDCTLVLVISPICDSSVVKKLYYQVLVVNG